MSSNRRMPASSTKRLVLEIFYFLFGTALAGFGIALFVTPAKIVGGGASGIGTIFYHLFGFDTGLVMIIVNIPIFFTGILVFGKTYALKSFLGAIGLSVWVSIFGQLTSYQGILPYVDRVDTLLSAIFGGVIVGAGIGIVMKSGANTGGTDILAQIISHFTPIPLGNALFLADAIVIGIGAVAFGIERALFAIITLYLSGQMVNYVVMNMGTKYAKTAYIVSEHYQKIGERIITELRHGGTLIRGTGIYTSKERTMLMAVVHNQEITQLTKIVNEEDPKAFMIVHETYQALGEGFSPMTSITSGSESRRTPKRGKAD